MSTYTDQINIHGRTVWLPDMQSTQAAEALRREIEAILAETSTTDLRSALLHLAPYGWGVIWGIDPFGPEGDTYKLYARGLTSASHTLERLEREHKPEALPGVLLSDMLTMAQAAKLTGLERQTLLARVKSARNPLPAKLVGNQYMVTREDLEAWSPCKSGPKTKGGNE